MKNKNEIKEYLFDLRHGLSQLLPLMQPVFHTLAKEQAEMFKSKTGSIDLIPEEMRIKKCEMEYTEIFEATFEALTETFASGFSVIKQGLIELSPLKREQIQKEIENAAQLLSSAMIKDGENLFFSLAQNQGLSDAFQISKETLEILYQMGVELYEQQRYADSASLFFVLISLNPFYVSFWVSLGMALKKQEKWTESLGAFASATILDPDDPLPRLCSIECHTKMNNISNALSELDQVKKIAEHKDDPSLNIEIENIYKKLRA